jgi:hypothetical protein
MMVAMGELMYKANLQAKQNKVGFFLVASNFFQVYLTEELNCAFIKKVDFKEAVKSKMRLSISGYEDTLKDFRHRKNGGGVGGDENGSNQITAFPNLELN